MIFAVLAVTAALLVGLYLALGPVFPGDQRRLGISMLVWGLVAIIPVYIIQLALAQRFIEDKATVPMMLLIAFLIRSLPEGLVLIVALYANTRRAYSCPTRFHGVVYALFLFMGFSAAECISVALSPISEFVGLSYLTSLPIQTTIGALAGWLYGRSRIYPELYRVHNALAIALPTLLHTLFEFGLLGISAGYAYGAWLLGVTLVPAFAAFLFFFVRELRQKVKAAHSAAD